MTLKPLSIITKYNKIIDIQEGELQAKVMMIDEEMYDEIIEAGIEERKILVDKLLNNAG